ncbi:STAS domain-containing protein [Thalassotalea marina]|uniref:STAS domain-containing protein n=1 Tax=Thalassotalea marina TaxID=1673741 RepID=A0A919BJR1_9GAMM|nr:STAS domain-containing protein [Thalassotalea marina]GHF93328.1 STAS domain-containing protein [Thalassotalea marina]
MALKKFVSDDGKKITISVDERFDFSVHQSFRDAYIDADTIGSEFILDLSKTTYMDSSALGMILLLKDHVEKSSSSLKISKPNDTVNKVLEIAQFHRLMTIER